MLLLDRARVGNEIFDDFPVHQRFSAEKVHFEIATSPAVFNEKIQSALANFKRHERSLAVILALRCKAIFAIEIAGGAQREGTSLWSTVSQLCKQIDVGLELVL